MTKNHDTAIIADQLFIDNGWVREEKRVNGMTEVTFTKGDRIITKWYDFTVSTIPYYYAEAATNKTYRPDHIVARFAKGKM